MWLVSKVWENRCPHWTYAVKDYGNAFKRPQRNANDGQHCCLSLQLRYSRTTLLQMNQLLPFGEMNKPIFVTYFIFTSVNIFDDVCIHNELSECIAITTTRVYGILRKKTPCGHTNILCMFSAKSLFTNATTMTRGLALTTNACQWHIAFTHLLKVAYECRLALHDNLYHTCVSWYTCG